MKSGVIITEEFINIVAPAAGTLAKRTRCKAIHSYQDANKNGRGTFVLVMFPPSESAYNKHKRHWDAFFSTIKEAGYMEGDEYTYHLNTKDDPNRFTVCAAIKNMEYYNDEEDENR